MLGDDFDAYGGDLPGHLHRINWLKNSIEDGQFSFWNSYENIGNPLPFIYPAISYLVYIPALLLMGVKTAFKFTNTLLYFFAGWGMYHLSKKIGLDRTHALLSAIFYMTYSWTSMTNIWEGAVATIVGFAILPATVESYFERKKYFVVMLALNFWLHVYNSAFLLVALPFFRRPTKRDLVLVVVAGLLYLPYFAPTYFELTNNISNDQFFTKLLVENNNMPTFGKSTKDLFSPFISGERLDYVLKRCPLNNEFVCKGLSTFFGKFKYEAHNGSYYIGLTIHVLALLGIVLNSCKKKWGVATLIFIIYAISGGQIINAIFEKVPFVLRAFHPGRTFHLLRLFASIGAAAALKSVGKYKWLIASIVILDSLPMALSFGLTDATSVEYCSATRESAFWIDENNEYGLYGYIECAPLDVKTDRYLRAIESPSLETLIEKRDFEEMGEVGIRFWPVRKAISEVFVVAPTKIVYESKDMLVSELDYRGRVWGDRCQVSYSENKGKLNVNVTSNEPCKVTFNYGLYSGWNVPVTAGKYGNFEIEFETGVHEITLEYDFDYISKYFRQNS